CGGFVGCVPGWMLIDPGNVGLAPDGQYGTPLAFGRSGFLACWRSLGKRRNIPSDETRSDRKAVETVGWAKRSVPTLATDDRQRLMVGTAQGRLCPPYALASPYGQRSTPPRSAAVPTAD